MTNTYDVQEEVKIVSSNIKERSRTVDFVALHARIDNEWMTFCHSDSYKVTSLLESFSQHVHI